jgi:hypothetical protein
MTSTISDAVRRGPSAASHLVRTHELYPHVKSGELTLRKSQVAVVHRRTTMAVFNSATIPTNGFSNAGFADISLSGADIISGITLRLTYANNTGAQLNQWKARWAWYIFDHLDILAENGSVVLERLEPEHLSKSWHELPPAAHERVKEGLQSGFDSNDTGNPPATNDGTSTTLYFPLLGCSLATQEIPPFALSSPIIIRCYFRGSAVFTGPYTAQMIPNGPPTITAFDAITTAYQLDASERNDLARRYAMAGLRSSPPLDIRMARPGFQKTQETFSGGTLHTIRLSSVQGLVTSMAVILQKIDSQGFGYGLYYPPHRVDLLDEKGSSLFGQPLDYNLLQVTQALTDGGTHDFNLNKLLALPIGGFSGEASGQIHGYVPMSGNHQLQVQADAGDYTVTIIYRTVAHMRVERAHLTVHSS